jgi:large subunit ribosomal protein L4
MAKSTPTTTGLDIFKFTVNPAVIAQAIYVYQSNTHRGTSKVKSRGEIVMTTRKMYKQKGTGNARHGTSAAPQFVGGGVVFGPTGHQSTPKKLTSKMKILALAGILSTYHSQDLLSSFDPSSVKDSKTQTAVKALGNLAPNTTLVIGTESQDFLKSIRNLPLTLRSAVRLNALHIAQSRKVVFTESALEQVTARVTPIAKQA